MTDRIALYVANLRKHEACAGYCPVREACKAELLRIGRWYIEYWRKA
jgi:hypothetical protein